MIRESGDWSYNDSPIVSSERLTLARLNWCIYALGALGCPIPRLSRIEVARQLCEQIKADKATIESDEVRSQIAEVQRIAWEFMLILVAAMNLRGEPSPFTPGKLGEMLLGSLLPTDGAEDPARDIQFELYVPALLALGGFAVHPGPPDSKVTLFGEQVGVEAKRIRTLNSGTLHSHLRRASRQAVGSRMVGKFEVIEHRGIIAVNLDSYFGHLSPAANSVDLIAEFEKCLQTLDRETRVLRDKTGILGLLACGYVAGWTSTSVGNARFDVLYPTRWMSLHGDDPIDRRLAEHLANALERMENRCREIQARVPKAA